MTNDPKPIKQLDQAIKTKHPDLTTEEVTNFRNRVLDRITKGLGLGELPVSVAKNKDGKFSIKPL